MVDAGSKHVFVSYVREDSAQVDGLCSVLEAAQIPYWRDRTSLGPGDVWKTKIREAIQSGSLVFLACFSDNSRAKDRSHMNEELTLAVSEYRKMPPGRTWLIPVRFDGGDIPAWDLGAGELISDLNYVDLHGAGHAAAAASLVTTIHNVMGRRQLNPAATLEAVEQVHAADRVDLVRRLTKEMLLDPQRRIQLDELVSQEVQRVLTVLNDGSWLAELGGTGEEQIGALSRRAQQLADLVLPFCASMQVAARFGAPDSLGPWANGIRAFVTAGGKQASGVSALIEQRRLPGLVALMVAGLACTAAGRWDNLKVLVAEQSVKVRHQSFAVPVLEATDPGAPFNSGDWTPHVLARAAMEDKTFEEALQDLAVEKVIGKYHTPVSEWLYRLLRELFKDQLPDDDSYGAEFDRAEVMLGIVATDLVATRVAASSETRPWGRAYWFGRATWRSRYDYGNPVDDFAQELSAQGDQWGPLAAGLFGGLTLRANAALTSYAKDFEEVGRGRQ